MARPKRGNYATGPAGQERYKKALREYLKKTKAAKEKTKITLQKRILKSKKLLQKLLLLRK